MPIWCLSFGDSVNYGRAVKRIQHQAAHSGYFDCVLVKTQADFDAAFQQQHGKFVAQNRRGFGYWLWKPYFIQQVLAQMPEGDILVYLDAGCTIKSDTAYARQRFQHYISLLQQSNHSSFGFQLGQPEKQWTKMDLVQRIFGTTNTPCRETGQLVGGIALIKATAESRQLVNEWYEIAQADNYHYLNDSPSRLPNDVVFVEHRHDQSIFSLLRKKYGVELIQDETYKRPNNPLQATRCR
jgi:hypothetical protein